VTYRHEKLNISNIFSCIEDYQQTDCSTCRMNMSRLQRQTLEFKHWDGEILDTRSNDVDTTPGGFGDRQFSLILHRSSWWKIDFCRSPSDFWM